jgi:hypothetical protein
MRVAGFRGYPLTRFKAEKGDFGLLLSPMIAGARRFRYVSKVEQTPTFALGNVGDAGHVELLTGELFIPDDRKTQTSHDI